MNRIARKFESFRQQSGLTKLLLIPAWCLTAFARAAVLLLPFKNIAPHLGRHNGTTAFIPLLSEAQQARVLSIGRAVRMASTLAPWQANCQAQAIAVRILLGIYSLPHVIFYGVAKDPVAHLKAHAWVASGPIQVTGGYAFDEFTVVAVFSNA